MVDLKVLLQSKLTDLTRQLVVANKSLAYNQQHQDSLQEYRKAANDALEQRNVALVKLKAVEQERDRWEVKYVSVHRY